jgi:hypothetical protein
MLRSALCWPPLLLLLSCWAVGRGQGAGKAHADARLAALHGAAHSPAAACIALCDTAHCSAWSCVSLAFGTRTHCALWHRPPWLCRIVRLELGVCKSTAVPV